MGGDSASVTADIGLDFSAFSLMLPWQQAAVQQSQEEDDAADAGASGPVSARFQRSLETVNLWKAQQNMKAMRGTLSTHGSPRTQAPGTLASEWRNRVAVSVHAASARLGPMTATTEPPLTEVGEAELDVFGGVANLLSSLAEDKPKAKQKAVL